MIAYAFIEDVTFFIVLIIHFIPASNRKSIDDVVLSLSKYGSFSRITNVKLANSKQDR